MKFVIGVAALILGFATQASAQSTVYSEDFETGAPGWTFDAAVGGLSWAVDGTPAMSFGAFSCAGLGDPASNPTVFAGANALNFNNGTDIDYSPATSAAGNSATGPLITVTSLTGLTMTFQDFYECDSCAKANAHRRWVEILDGTGTVIKSVQLTYSDGTDTEESCAPLPVVGGIPGNWNNHHVHSFDLSTLTSMTFRVRCRIELSAATGVVETSAVGWFVDNINITCSLADVTAPTTPGIFAPADLSCTVDPVTFQWTPGSDTGPCGPGIIDHYELQIDTSVAFTFLPFSVGSGLSYTASGPAGTFFWHMRSVDAAGNPSPFGAIFSFTNTLPALPLPPDSLFVNDSSVGAQAGDSGSPTILDYTPALSAVYRDSNCNDLALQYYVQVSEEDPTFTTGLIVDSGLQPLTTPILPDTRCEDIVLVNSLSRNTTYYWRILFADASGSGAFSLPQTFSLADDFAFGIRNGSTHRGHRKCWVATAAWGSAEAAPVQALQSWRFGTMESSGAGSLVSRFYHVSGAFASSSFQNSEAVRSATLPLAWLSRSMIPVFLFGAAIILFGAFRAGKSS